MWLFVLLLLSVEGFRFAPFAGILSGDTGLVAYLFWLFGGCVVIRRKVSPLLFNWRNIFPVILIISGVFLSFIPAFLYYGQSFLRSFIVCRAGLVYFTLPVLLWVRPSFKDVKIALILFSAVYFVLMICDSYLHIPLIAKDEKAMIRAEEMAMRDESDVTYQEGIHFVAMAFFFSLGEMLKRLSSKCIFLTAFLFVTVLFYQNRSTLFSCVLIAALYLITLRNTRRNLKLKVFFFVVAAIFFAVSLGLWTSLFLETGSQLSNSDYNRNLAYVYFLLEAPQGMLNYILGCGFLSSNTTSLMQDMMAMGVYNSDVGFIGMWNQFGLIPVVTIVGYCFAHIGKGSSSLVKANSLFILLCSLTTAYFFDTSKILWLCIFLYLISLEGVYNKCTR